MAAGAVSKAMAHKALGDILNAHMEIALTSMEEAQNSNAPESFKLQIYKAAVATKEKLQELWSEMKNTYPECGENELTLHEDYFLAYEDFVRLTTEEDATDVAVGVISAADLRMLQVIVERHLNAAGASAGHVEEAMADIRSADSGKKEVLGAIYHSIQPLLTMWRDVFSKENKDLHLSPEASQAYQYFLALADDNDFFE